VDTGSTESEHRRKAADRVRPPRFTADRHDLIRIRDVYSLHRDGHSQHRRLERQIETPATV
jgi:hypothetical protein